MKVSSTGKKNEFKMYYRPKCKTIYTKLLKENLARTFFDINYSLFWLDPPPTAMNIKNKNKQMGPK